LPHHRSGAGPRSRGEDQPLSGDLAETVTKALAESLGIEAGRVDDRLSALTCEEWDSLAQLRLVLALEERLAIRFSLAEIEAATSRPAILRLVAAKTGRDG
jgi:acyl carrier protein